MKNVTIRIARRVFWKMFSVFYNFTSDIRGVGVGCAVEVDRANLGLFHAGEISGDKCLMCWCVSRIVKMFRNSHKFVFEVPTLNFHNFCEIIREQWELWLEIMVSAVARKTFQNNLVSGGRNRNGRGPRGEERREAPRPEATAGAGTGALLASQLGIRKS